MTDAVRLLETMRAEAKHGLDAIALWPLHRSRLLASAAVFGVDVTAEALDEAVNAALSGLPSRVRLTVGMDGGIRVEAAPLAGQTLGRVIVDLEPFVEAGSRYCINKTTRRVHYDERLQRAHAQGADEVLLVAPDGRLVEGTRTTVWIERDGRFVTPSLDAGGLPGVMRAHLLATRSDTQEADLTPADLDAADAVWLSNAVVGLIPVRVLPHPETG